MRRTLEDVGLAADSDGTLRHEELQQLLSKASLKGEKDDERFNPTVLMISFTEQTPVAGQEKKTTNSFLELILLSRKGETRRQAGRAVP